MVDTTGMGVRGYELRTVSCRSCHDPVDRSLAIEIEWVPSGKLEWECQGCYFKNVLDILHGDVYAPDPRGA